MEFEKYGAIRNNQLDCILPSGIIVCVPILRNVIAAVDR